MSVIGSVFLLPPSWSSSKGQWNLEEISPHSFGVSFLPSTYFQMELRVGHNHHHQPPPLSSSSSGGTMTSTTHDPLTNLLFLQGTWVSSPGDSSGPSTLQPSSFSIEALLGLGSRRGTQRVMDLEEGQPRCSRPSPRLRLLQCSSRGGGRREGSFSSKLPPRPGKEGGDGSPGGPPPKVKRVRTIFTPEQLERLESEFERQQYMVGPERLYLASSLHLSEAQVKVWFQNRRIKWRKQHLELTQQRLAALRGGRGGLEEEESSSTSFSSEDSVHNLS